MKNNLLFFTLILSGLSTHVFAAGDEEINQELPSYMQPTKSSESKKDSKRTHSKQEKNFKFGGKSSYQEGPFKQQSPEEMLEGQSPEVKRLVKQERKKYQASGKVSGSKYSDPTESSESKKDSKRTPLKQEKNFKFGGKSTYQEGPLKPVEETPRQKQLKDKVGTRFGKDSNDMQKTLKTAPSDITSTTSENSESF